MVISVLSKPAPVRCLLALFVLLTTWVVPPAQADEARWSELSKVYFGDAPILTGEGVLSLDAPKRAHDAATVPITIKATDAGRAIEELYVFVDMNPLPLAGIFRFTEEAGFWNALETRIRINEYTHVRAVGKLSNGELHMSERFVKASGGCSAPAMADMDAAMARAGKMQLFLDEVRGADDAPYSEAIIKISHPNNSGMQFDQISRNYIPAFFVNTIQAELDGVALMTIETNFSMSENPVVRLAFNSDTTPRNLTVKAIDSKGNQYEKSTAVAVK